MNTQTTDNNSIKKLINFENYKKNIDKPNTEQTIGTQGNISDSRDGVFFETFLFEATSKNGTSQLFNGITNKSNDTNAMENDFLIDPLENNKRQVDMLLNSGIDINLISNSLLELQLSGLQIIDSVDNNNIEISEINNKLVNFTTTLNLQSKNNFVPNNAEDGNEYFASLNQIVRKINDFKNDNATNNILADTIETAKLSIKERIAIEAKKYEAAMNENNISSKFAALDGNLTAPNNGAMSKTADNNNVDATNPSKLSIKERIAIEAKKYEAAINESSFDVVFDVSKDKLVYNPKNIMTDAQSKIIETATDNNIEETTSKLSIKERIAIEAKKYEAAMQNNSVDTVFNISENGLKYTPKNNIVNEIGLQNEVLSNNTNKKHENNSKVDFTSQDVNNNIEQFDNFNQLNFSRRDSNQNTNNNTDQYSTNNKTINTDLTATTNTFSIVNNSDVSLVENNTKTTESFVNQRFANVKMLDVPKVISEFGNQIGYQNVGIAKLVLNPQSLGTLFVELNFKGANPVISFKAETKEALDAIEKNLGSLKEMFAQSGMKDVDYKFERYQQENLNSKDTDLLKQNHSDRSYSERNQHNKNEENNTRREYSNIFKKANIQDEQIDDGANDILTSRYSSMMIEAYV